MEVEATWRWRRRNRRGLRGSHEASIGIVLTNGVGFTNRSGVVGKREGLPCDSLWLLLCSTYVTSACPLVTSVCDVSRHCRPEATGCCGPAASISSARGRTNHLQWSGSTLFSIFHPFSI